MFYRLGFVGQPGSGKTTLGLSAPGVEHHVFGSSEEMTAQGFVGRTDILPIVKLDWYDTLTPEEKLKFTDEKVSEIEVGNLTKHGRARNIRRYRQYLYRLKDELKAGKRPEVKSTFLDNLTPFSLEFDDYVEVVYGKEFVTKDGNFDTIAYYKRYASEFVDFLRLFNSLACNTLIAVHASMVASEEIGANTQFMQAAKMGGVKKEWQPLLTGKARFIFASIPDWVFYLRAEDSPGKPTRYVAKLEADDSNVGVAKSRVQPFDNPRQIEFPKGHAFEFFVRAMDEYSKTGKLQPSKGV